MPTLQGTAIKNTGYLDKVYFNTSLSTEEVTAILDTLYSDINYSDYTVCLKFESPQIRVWIRKRESYYSIICQKDRVGDFTFNTDPQNASEVYDIVSTGWRTSFDKEGFGNPFEFNAELSSTEADGDVVGSKNELLKNLISSTPFEVPTLDEFLTGIGDAIREVKGTTNKINALTFEDEIRKFSSDVIEVDELPTENIDENAIYKVNKATDINVYVKTGTNSPSTLFEAVVSLGVTPTITYYLVDNLPENPNVSDLITFSPLHIYIYDDVAYGYGNAGYGNMWLGVSDLISLVTGVSHTNKGYCSSSSEISEQGIYVTYKISTIGASSKSILKAYDSDWIDYKSIFLKKLKTFNNSVIATIPAGAFFNCKSLENVYIPNVVYIDYFAFQWCTGLKNVVFGDKLTGISQDAFIGCTSLTSITIPGSVTDIGSGAFSGCTSLKTVEIKEGVPELGYSAFSGCTSLESIIIPKSIVSFGQFVFSNCNALKDVYYTGTEEEWNAISIPSGNEELTSATIHYNYVPE